MSQIISYNQSNTLQNFDLPNMNKAVEPVLAFANSFGLQPFKIKIAEGENLPAKLRLAEKHPLRIPAQAKFILFSVYPTISRININAYIDNITKQKRVPSESLIEFRNFLARNINNPDSDGNSWSYRQAAVAIDKLVHSAKTVQLESLVIKDFDANEIDTAFKLEEQALHSFAIVALYQAGDNNISLPRAEKQGLQKDYRLV